MVRSKEFTIESCRLIKEGNIRIQDYTTAKNNLYRRNAKKFLTIYPKYGGVVGAGKEKFAGGTEIQKNQE